MTTDSTKSTAGLQSLAIDKGSMRRRGGVGRFVRGAFWPLLAGAAVLFAGAWWLNMASVTEVTTGKVQRVTPLQDFELVTAIGYLVPRTRASVASRVQGRLARVLVDEGDEVAANALLAEIERGEEDADVARAVADLQVAREGVRIAAANLAESEAARASAEATVAERKAAVVAAQATHVERDANLRRAEELFRAGVSTEAALDGAREGRDVARALAEVAARAFESAERRIAEARSRVAVAEAELVSARSRVSAAEATLARAEATRENTFIRAPFAGTILRREAEPGEVVSPANTGASGSKTAVVAMADFRTLEVEVDVYERDIARITAGTLCRIVLDSFPDQPHAGKVRLVRPTADRSKATIKVVAAFDAVPAVARPEMSARVVFVKGGGDLLAMDRVEAPARALTRRGEQDGVFVLTGRKVAFVAVQPGERVGERVVLRGGAGGGEQVVLDPPASLQDGAEVRVKD